MSNEGVNGNVTVSLMYPITIDGAEKNELVVRRAKWADVKLARNQGKGDDVRISEILMSNLCEIPPKVVDQMDMHDITAINEVIQGFLGVTVD